jgi:protein-S-isoprenylcysteine O-methyltransferase Ste14
MLVELTWKILLYGWWALEVYLLVRTRTRSGEGKVQDRGSLRVLWLTIFLSVTAATWIGSATPRQFGRHAGWVVVAAEAMLAFGLLFRVAAIVTLGRAFSVNVAIREGQRVMKDGLYGLVRHPSYTGLVIIFVALGLGERNYFSLAIMTVCPTAALLYRIHVEEAALREHFGAEYVAYCAETKRLVPGVY